MVTRRIRISELHAVEQVEHLRPEFQLEPLGYRCLLEQGDVEIVDPGPPEDGIGQAFVAQRVCGWNRETGHVKPAVQTGLGRAAQFRITAWYYVGTQAQVEAGDVGGGSQAQREALLECSPSAHGPAGGELLDRGVPAIEESLAFTEGKIDGVSYGQALAGVESCKRFFGAEIVRVLGSVARQTHAAIQPGGQTSDIGNKLGEGIGRKHGAALGETLFDLHLQRMIGGVAKISAAFRNARVFRER